jgi:hypothetical protein
VTSRDAPETIEFRRGSGTLVYRRDPRLTCIASEDDAARRASRWSLPEEGLAVVETADAAGRASRPVYRLGDGPLPFVPTGRLWVRLPPGQSLANAADALSDLGLRIAKVHEVAPHAGWVEDARGHAVAALASTDLVRERLGAEVVEPELLTVKR